VPASDWLQRRRREPDSASPSSPPTQRQADLKACLLRISGGFEDKAFSQAASDGLDRAASELGVKTLAVDADAEADYGNDLDALVERGCDDITTVTYLVGDATRAAARKNPEVDFSIVDFAHDRPPENLKGLLFDSASPAFLAGYLAAGVSETGVVGTFGGAQIPSVTVYMDGFHAGVDRYNEDNGTDVQLLGWDRETQKGTFTNDFGSRTKGRSVAAEMITQGADIIFPVAGAAGLGALQAVEDADVRAIWSDTDGCVSAVRYCDVLLTSVVKGMDAAVFDSIKASVEGSFDNSTYVGTLENGGVGLASYHEQHDAVPADLDDQLQELEQQIIDGELEVD
jgi:basic membrane protein A